MQAIRGARTLFVRTSGRPYHKAVDFKIPTMDELPVPSGSWQEWYSARNRKNNATLVAGVAFFGFSIFVGKASGLIYLNFSPPDSID